MESLYATAMLPAVPLETTVAAPPAVPDAPAEALPEMAPPVAVAAPPAAKRPTVKSMVETAWAEGHRKRANVIGFIAERFGFAANRASVGVYLGKLGQASKPAPVAALVQPEQAPAGPALVPAEQPEQSKGRCLRQWTSRNSIRPSAHLRDCWKTPRELFDKLHQAFGFTVDACASADNALLPRYWDETADALKQDWRGERVFCNPPFSLQKFFPAMAATAELAVVLLYHTGLFTQYIADNPPAAIALPKRIAFIPPAGLKASSPPFGVAVCVWGEITDEQWETLAELGMVTQTLKSARNVLQPEPCPILRFLAQCG